MDDVKLLRVLGRIAESLDRIAAALENRAVATDSEDR